MEGVSTIYTNLYFRHMKIPPGWRTMLTRQAAFLSCTVLEKFKKKKKRVMSCSLINNVRVGKLLFYMKHKTCSCLYNAPHEPGFACV